MSELPSIELLRAEIVKVAESAVGEREKRNNSGFINPEFEKQMREVGFQTGHAWCAYFVEYVWVGGYKEINPAMMEHLKRLFSGSVMATRNNFRSKSAQDLGFRFSETAKPGDLAVWQSLNNRAFGHIAIVTSEVTSRTEFFTTIEGNTNDDGGREGIEVARKRRRNEIGRRAPLVLLGFINLAVIPEPNAKKKQLTEHVTADE